MGELKLLPLQGPQEGESAPAPCLAWAKLPWSFDLCKLDIQRPGNAYVLNSHCNFLANP